MTNPSTPPVLQRAVPSYRLGTTSARLGPFITTLYYNARYRLGTASVPLRYRSGPLLQCAVPPRYRFGTARALYYNAQRRHPVCVLQSFNSVGVMNFQENTKTNRNPQNATLTLVPALLQTGRSTLAPRHSEYSSRSTILNKGLGVGLAIDVSKVKLYFRVNLWPSFWGPKTLAKPVSPRRASPVCNADRPLAPLKWAFLPRKYPAFGGTVNNVFNVHFHHEQEVVLSILFFWPVPT